MTRSGKAAPTARSTTGVEGLDEVLGGGFPRNRIYLVRGDPGVGKTTLALQFLLEGVRQGEAGLYVTLSETREELDEVASSHGWNLKGVQLFELAAIQKRIEGEANTTFFHPSEVELNRTVKVLLDEVERVQPQRFVIDSLSEIRMLAETPLRFRRQVLQFKQFFASRKTTVLLLDDRSEGARDLQIESIAHGVVGLQCTSPEYGVARRRVRVEKIRGSRFREGNHDLILQRGGLRVFPRLVASEHFTDFRRETFPSGLPELDRLLGGGLDRGTSNMFIGPPGAGKSTLALKFAHVAAERGEHAHLYLFDETVATLLSRAALVGLDLKPHLRSGRIKVDQINPAQICPGEFAHALRQAVTQDQARIVIIDSINGYLNAMLHERHLSLQLHELLAYLNQQGVITVMVLAQRGVIGTTHTAVDLTYLADTVLLLRYFEDHGHLKQAISVVKKRSGHHERAIREMNVGEGGLEVGEVLSDFHGVFGGTPQTREDGGRISGDG